MNTPSNETEEAQLQVLKSINARLGLLALLIAVLIVLIVILPVLGL